MNSATTRRGECGMSCWPMLSISFILMARLSSDWSGRLRRRADTAVEHEVGVAEGFFDLLRRACDGGGVGDSPVGSHRLAGPDGADFFGGVVADGENKIEFGRAGCANSSQVLLRRPAVGTCADSSCWSASGRTLPVGRLPAL